MEYTIELQIDCGKETCASSKGNFCKYFGSKKFGTIPWCTLFNQELFIDVESSWHLRCQQCYDSSFPSSVEQN